MPNTAENQDIAFQPASKGYSYSNSGMSEQKSSEKKRGVFFILLIEILGLLFLFFIFLAVLNYYSIISLNSINPTLFGWLPQGINSIQQQKGMQTEGTTPIFLPQTNSWKAEGTLSQYNDNLIQIKVGGQIIKLTFSYENSMFYKQTSALNGSTTPSATSQNIPYTLYDLEQQVNLGKKVEVLYTTDKSGNNTIQMITLLN
jgi:hypothetical protein